MNNDRFLLTIAIHVAAGKSIRDAAAAAECSESTAYRLASTAEFRGEVARIRDEALSRAVGVLNDAATKASETLVEILGSDYETKDRIAAARLILSNIAPVTELGEIRNRISKLEGATQLKVTG